MQASCNICTLGSANVDYFVYVHHIPLPGETIQASKYMIANGGKGANQSVAVSKLEGKSIFIGQVGKDDQMQSLKQQMEKSKVKIQWMQCMGISTGKAFIYVDEGTGENSIVIIGGANMHYELNMNQLPNQYRENINASQYLLLQKQIPIFINLLAAKYAKSKSKIVILDCGGRDDEIPEELINQIDYISPNQTQLKRINSTIDENHIVEQIRNKIINKHKNLKVLLKLGHRGSAIITAEEYVQCPIASVLNTQIDKDYHIVDTVGAGDCFIAAFIVRHSELYWNEPKKRIDNYRQSMLFGNCAAFLCITQRGAMPSMPQRKQVQKFMEKYKIK